MAMEWFGNKKYINVLGGDETGKFWEGRSHKDEKVC